MTLMEVVVVIVILAVLAAMLLPANSGSHRKAVAMRIACVNNLKQIGLAYRLWPDGQSDKYPMQVSIKHGGTLELLNTANAWKTFQVMSNYLSTPKILFCPADTDKFAATNFSTNFDSRNISYFVGLDANENDPQAILSGDDNFEISGIPVKSGLLELSTNTPIAWTAARHKFTGNILLADGSVQTVTISGLSNLLHQTGLATNRLAIP